jgi:hypothetical protein
VLAIGMSEEDLPYLAPTAEAVADTVELKG